MEQKNKKNSFKKTKKFTTADLGYKVSEENQKLLKMLKNLKKA
ncbi:hypothetical protein [Metabacillus sp. FJAT-52054]|uniref:Uncharacterized protein n=1 Tax=Metabacillus sediminis TaxID=3117746 RepID=A0ABZ2NKZ4_9BACI